jgi:catechol 2,3-dioxygenase-like lactoylglutathione lyase family enzyme
MSNVRHAGIVVEHLDRQIGFYQDVLGMTVRARAVESGPFIDALLGLPDCSVETVKLVGSDGGALIELLHFQNPGSPERRDISVTTPGPTHVALTVKDLEALEPRMRAAGATSIGPVQLSPDGKVRVAYFRDPEGNFLEVVEEQ